MIQKSDWKAIAINEITTTVVELPNQIWFSQEPGKTKKIVKIVMLYFIKKNTQNWTTNFTDFVSWERKVKKAEDEPRSRNCLMTIEVAIKNTNVP